MVKILIFDDFLFEPITFVDVPFRGFELLERKWICLPVYPQGYYDFKPMTTPQSIEFNTIDIRIERFRRDHEAYGIQESLLGFTSRDDLARLLIPSWLPGQKGAVNELMMQNDRLTEMIMRVLR